MNFVSGSFQCLHLMTTDDPYQIANNRNWLHSVSNNNEHTIRYLSFIRLKKQEMFVQAKLYLKQCRGQEDKTDMVGWKFFSNVVR